MLDPGLSTLTTWQTFESTLKEVVEAKRLSQSRMKKLTDNALKCMKVRAYDFVCLHWLTMFRYSMTRSLFPSFTARTRIFRLHKRFPVSMCLML